MNWAPWRKNQKQPAVNDLKLTDVEEWMELFGGGHTFSGTLVNQDTAMKATAVYACVRLIAGTVGMLPAKVFKKTEKGRDEDQVNPLYTILHDTPNPLQTAPVFWEALMTSALLAGNGYGLIGRHKKSISYGDPASITWIHPRRVKPYLKNGRIVYPVMLDNNTFVEFDQDDIFHLPGVGWDGVSGMSPITWAGRQAIGLALAAEEHSARFFGQGATPHFALKYPKALSPEQAEQLRDYWSRKMAGLTNSHTPVVLTEGGEAQQLTMSAEDSQLLQSRQFQVIDIARIYGVPPHMIGETTKSTSWGVGLEQQNMGFVTYTLGPWLAKIQAEAKKKLFRGDFSSNFLEFHLGALLRGDSKTRNDVYNIARGGTQGPGYMTINEIRKLENLPPVEGGDVLYRPTEKNGGNNEPQAPSEPPHGPTAPTLP